MGMKHLTTYERTEIVNKIMDDIPTRDGAGVMKEVQAKIVQLMSPACQAVYATTPQALVTDSDWEICGDWSHRIMGDVSRRSPEYKAAMKPYYDTYNARRALRSKIEKQLEQCKTVKQLYLQLPDFAKYFPPLPAHLQHLANPKPTRTAKDTTTNLTAANPTSTQSTTRTRRSLANMTADELLALAEAKRKKEEADAMRTVKTFGLAAELAAMGWDPK